jgi:hypothetical protein
VSDFEAYVELVRQNNYLDYVEIEIPTRVLDEILLEIDEGFIIDIFEDELRMELDESIYPPNHKYFSKRLVNPISKSFLIQTIDGQNQEHLKIFNISEMQFDGSTWKPTNLKFKIKISKTNDNPHEIELFGQAFPLKGHVIGVVNCETYTNLTNFVDIFSISTFGNLGHTYDKLDAKTTLDKMKKFGIKLNFLFAKNDFGTDFDESLHYVTKNPIDVHFNSMLNNAIGLDHFSSFPNHNHEQPLAQVMAKNFYLLNLFPPMQPYFIPPNSNSMHGPQFDFNQYQSSMTTPNFQSNPTIHFTQNSNQPNNILQQNTNQVNISEFPVAPPGFDHKVEYAFRKIFPNFNPTPGFFEQYKNK